VLRTAPRALTPSVLAVTLLLLAWRPAVAVTPTESIRDLFQGVSAILADPATREHPLDAVERVRQLVSDTTDAGAAAAAALGGEWHGRSAEERDEFVDLFAQLLERAYVGRLAGTVRAGGAAVSYRGEVVQGDEAAVTTAFAGRQDDVVVEYRLTSRDRRWLVRDVVLDGVSIVGNFHAQFRRLLSRGSYADLLARLRAKLGEETLLFARAPPRRRTARPQTRLAQEAPAASTPALFPTALPAPAAAPEPPVMPAAGVLPANPPPAVVGPAPIPTVAVATLRQTPEAVETAPSSAAPVTAEADVAPVLAVLGPAPSTPDGGDRFLCPPWTPFWSWASSSRPAWHMNGGGRAAGTLSPRPPNSRTPTPSRSSSLTYRLIRCGLTTSQ
jgi:phospholipid transport system substrate-binding protein